MDEVATLHVVRQRVSGNDGGASVPRIPSGSDTKGGASASASNPNANTGTVRFLADGTACVVDNEDVGPVFCGEVPIP